MRALPGVGAYTAAAIAAIAFGRQTAPVDGNIARILARLLALEKPIARARGELAAAARALAPSRRAGDFAQALMDIGATLCRPRNPVCGSCPLALDCARVPHRRPRRPIRAAPRRRRDHAGKARFSSPAVPTAPFSLAAARPMAFSPRHSSCRARPGPRKARATGSGRRSGRRALAPAARRSRTGLHPFRAEPHGLRRGVRRRRPSGLFLGRFRRGRRGGILSDDAEGGRTRPGASLTSGRSIVMESSRRRR